MSKYLILFLSLSACYLETAPQAEEEEVGVTVQAIHEGSPPLGCDGSGANNLNFSCTLSDTSMNSSTYQSKVCATAGPLTGIKLLVDAQQGAFYGTGRGRAIFRQPSGFCTKTKLIIEARCRNVDTGSSRYRSVETDYLWYGPTEEYLIESVCSDREICIGAHGITATVEHRRWTR